MVDTPHTRMNWDISEWISKVFSVLNRISSRRDRQNHKTFWQDLIVEGDPIKSFFHLVVVAVIIAQVVGLIILWSD